jgi:hypothetical protein
MSIGIGDILRADVVGLYNNAVTIQNTYQVRNIGGEVDELDAVTDVTDLLEGLYTLLAGILSILYVVQRVRVINVSDDTDVGIGGFADPTPGTNNTGYTAPQVCYGLNLTTVKLGNRGRKFFGPVAEALIDSNGVLSAGTITALTNAGSYMVTDQVMTNSTWEFGIKGTVDGVWRKFVGYSAPATAVTQRRRRQGVGV